MEKVIGVLGGMGPEATLSFYAKLLASTPARRDQDHLRVIIDSNPKVPDRTAALLGQGDSPVPMMAAGLEALARAGAELAVIPCVSAHAFLDELRARSPIPILSILDVAAEAVRGQAPSVRTVGLMATTGTVRSGAFQAALAAAGIGVRVPAPPEQERVMAAIYSIKGALGNAERRALRDALIPIARGLIAQGAEAIVLGCTELPLVLADADLGVPVFDVVLLLARAAIVAAGREPAA